LFSIVNTNIDYFVDFYRELFKYSTIVDDDYYKKLNDKTIIFEGAQGLALDEDYKYFPHVTRSKTGLKNVVELAKKIGLKEIEAVYVTRWYVTRHGAGPLPHEVDYKLSGLIYDKTNIPNPYQDTMRFGILDVDWLSDNIRNDLKNVLFNGIEIEPVLALTCIDQLDSDYFFFIKDNYLCSMPDIWDLGEAIGLEIKYTSNGEKRKNTY
jgi:adenylosuccinate synthase